MLGFIFSALWQWLLGKFGMSDAQKLGRAEVTNSQLKADLVVLKAEDEAARDTPHGKAETIEALKHGEL